MNFYNSNNRMMAKGDPRVFRLPCRFPAKPSILAQRRAQVYDKMRLFGARREAKKNFTLSFPVRQGTGEAALPCPLPRPFGAAAATGSAAIARSRRASSP
jgi:hypothetical protein